MLMISSNVAQKSNILWSEVMSHEFSNIFPVCFQLFSGRILIQSIRFPLLIKKSVLLTFLKKFSKYRKSSAQSLTAIVSNFITYFINGQKLNLNFDFNQTVYFFKVPRNLSGVPFYLENNSVSIIRIRLQKVIKCLGLMTF